MTPKGDPAKFLEAVFGWSAPGCLFWPFSKNSHGYGHLYLNGVIRGAHRVVCEKTHGPPPSRGHHAAHSCGNGHLGCVNPRHLRWATPAENSAEMIKHGRSMRGERCASSTLTEDQTVKIYHLAISGEFQHIIAEEFGISQSAVSRIKLGKRWGWLTGSAA